MLLFRGFSLTALVTFITLASAAVIAHPPSLLLLLLTNPDPSSTHPNTSLPSNQTLSPPSNALPPSPYIYPIPTPPAATTVTFSAYTGPISELAALECILAATEDVATALEAALRDRDPDRVIAQRYIRIDAEHASLIVATSTTREGRRMTWVTWGQTLKALTAFLRRWEVVGFRFVVEVEGVMVGVGVLAGR